MKKLQLIIITLLVLTLSSCDLIPGSETEITIAILQGQDTVEINTANDFTGTSITKTGPTNNQSYYLYTYLIYRK